MEDKQITEMCKRLANKYSNYSEYDDLVSTGVVACLEMKALGENDPSKLYYKARRFMNDYMNHQTQKISYSRGARGIAESKKDNYEYTDHQNEVIKAESLEESFELRNCLRKLLQLLDPREKKVLYCLYINNNDLKETSSLLGLSRVTVTMIRNSIRDKVVTICDLTLT